jgi:sialic acid synthase SpsE
MITFEGRSVGPGSPCLVIAELGTSHQGDLGRARIMIDAAVASGAECIKFQLVHASEILHPRSGFVPLPTGQVALYEQFRSLEREIGRASCRERV